MKKYLITLFLSILGTTVLAQYHLDKGKIQLNVGVGFSSWGKPIYGAIDYGLKKDISLGTEISYRNLVKKSDAFYIVKGVSGNINYHFGKVLNLPKDIDIYGGLNVGFFQWQSGNLQSNKWNTGLQAGARYFFKNNLAIHLEAGIGNAFSAGKIGLTFILK
ncbi:MAG: hypothetical protein ACKVQB_10880 [Bacteroidia bacterium]